MRTVEERLRTAAEWVVQAGPQGVAFMDQQSAELRAHLRAVGIDLDDKESVERLFLTLEGVYEFAEVLARRSTLPPPLDVAFSDRNAVAVLHYMVAGALMEHRR